MDATLITAHSDKQGATATLKKGYTPYAEGLVCEYCKMSGHAAPSQERQIEHV